jgi:predicted metalloprotease with PDZ domain
MGTLSSQSYEDLKWFKEGFTEYYAQLLTYEAAEQPISSCRAALNEETGT